MCKVLGVIGQVKDFVHIEKMTASEVGSLFPTDVRYFVLQMSL